MGDVPDDDDALAADIAEVGAHCVQMEEGLRGMGVPPLAAVDDSGLHLVNLPPVSYVFKDGEPSGWVHAMLEQDGMSLALRCIDPKHKLHGQSVALKWRDD